MPQDNPTNVALALGAVLALVVIMVIVDWVRKR